jgi:uncharacterized protein with PQ loop repeat
MLSFGLSHYTSRHKKLHLSKLLHKKKSVVVIDRFVMVVSIISPLSTIPQIVQIIILRDASTTSVWMYVLMLVMAFFWLIYGFAHREKIIIINNIMWISVNVTVIVLTCIY